MMALLPLQCSFGIAVVWCCRTASTSTRMMRRGSSPPCCGSASTPSAPWAMGTVQSHVMIVLFMITPSPWFSVRTLSSVGHGYSADRYLACAVNVHGHTLTHSAPWATGAVHSHIMCALFMNNPPALLAMGRCTAAGRIVLFIATISAPLACVRCTVAAMRVLSILVATISYFIFQLRRL